MARNNGLSVIIPAHNEEKTIYRMVEETSRAMTQISSKRKFAYEIVVVNDGSNDDTLGEASRAKRDFEGVSVVNLRKNLGKGNALKSGFQASKMELVCFLDADLDLHPSQIETLLGVMEETHADIVIGSKRHPLSEVNYPTSRKIYSAVYYSLVKLLFHLPLKDTQTGLKLFRREVLSRAFPRMLNKKYVLDLELLLVAHQLGYKIAEAPVKLDFQRIATRIKWDDIRGIIVDTLALFYRLHFLKYYQSPLKPLIEREPKVSIVIPTARVGEMVRECIEGCKELDYQNFEITLVSNEMPTSDPGLEDVKVILSESVGFFAKRNEGAKKTDSEIIAFIDPDASPDSYWLKNAIPYFEDDDVAAVGGPGITSPEDSRRGQASGMVYSATIVSGSTTYRHVFRAPREVDDYPAFNLLVRKSDFQQAGGFAEEYDSGGDTLLCLRLTRELGKKIYYVPNVSVSRHREPLFIPHMKQVYSYAAHRGFFTRKFPQTSRRLQYFVPSIFLLWLAGGLVGSFFSTLVLRLYLSVLGLYAFLLLASSIKSLDPLLNLLVIPGIFLTHLTYGVGFLRGLFSRRMKGLRG